jgi:peroxin-16
MNVLREYDNYILKNAAQISSIESSLRTITYILPSPLPSPSPD